VNVVDYNRNNYGYNNPHNSPSSYENHQYPSPQIPSGGGLGAGIGVTHKPLCLSHSAG
jgi:hypothetical protein